MMGLCRKEEGSSAFLLPVRQAHTLPRDLPHMLALRRGCEVTERGEGPGGRPRVLKQNLPALGPLDTWAGNRPLGRGLRAGAVS